MDDYTQNPSGPNESTSPFSALQSAFEAQELQARDRFYDIGESEQLIDKLKAALAQSETGARLVKMAEDQGIKITLIKSRYLQSAATPNREVYLAAEAGQKDPQMPQLLEFGGVLREAEQFLMGYTAPAPDEDELEKASRIHAKFLDKIVFMCKIGIELEQFYGSRVDKAIKAFGYEDIYQAHKDALNEEQVKDIYLSHQKQGVDEPEEDENDE